MRENQVEAVDFTGRVTQISLALCKNYQLIYDRNILSVAAGRLQLIIKAEEMEIGPWQVFQGPDPPPLTPYTLC